MTKYLKQIQSRLSRRGVNISQSEIREVYQKVVSDVENPTEEELTTVTESFLNSLTTTNQGTEITTNTQSESEIQNASQNQIQPTEEPQAPAEKADHLALLDESQKTTTITTTPHGEIVQKAFSQLGFTATEKEIFEIIKAFESTQKVGDEFFDQVLPLVKEWIRKKTEKQVQKYEQAYEEIAGDVCESLQEIAEAKGKCDTNLFIFRQTFGPSTENFQDDTRKSITNIEEFLTNW